MKTEKRLTMALSVLVALMMLAVPLASSSNLFVDGGQTNSNGDAPMLSANESVEIVEVWIINDQTSLNKIGSYLTPEIQNKNYTDLWDDECIADGPWIAVAFKALEAGEATVTVSNPNSTLTDDTYTFTKSNCAADTTYVFTAYLNGTPDANGKLPSGISAAGKDALKISDESKFYTDNYTVTAKVGSDGVEATYTMNYGDLGKSYDVSFNLNDVNESGKKSLDEVIVNGLGTTTGISWYVDENGIYHAIVNSGSIYVEQLVSIISNAVSKTGYTLDSWKDADGNVYSTSAVGTTSVKKDMSFSAVWLLKDGYKEVPVNVVFDDQTTEYVKAYMLIGNNDDKVEIKYAGLNNSIKTIAKLDLNGIVVNNVDDKNSPAIKPIYSDAKLTYGDKTIEDSAIISADSTLTATYTFNDREYSKIVIHSEAFKGGKDVTLFALKNADYTYNQIFKALQFPTTETDGIKAALSLKDDGNLDGDKNATTSDNYYLLTGWNDGAELLDSQRNAPAELTLDSRLNGYNVIFMSKGQYEIVYIPYGELSADKCTLDTSGLNHWVWMDHTDYSDSTFSGIQSFNFNQSQINVIEKLKNDHETPVAVFIACFTPSSSTSYAVFDAGDANFGNEDVDKIIIPGKVNENIPLPATTPAFGDEDNKMLFIDWKHGETKYSSEDKYSSSSVTEYDPITEKYSHKVTFYNGNDAVGVFYYYSGAPTSTDITANLVAFEADGIAYQKSSLTLNNKSDDNPADKVYESIIYTTKAGYDLKQWNDADGNAMIAISSKLVDGETVYSVDKVNIKELKNDLSLYAKFEPKKFNIVYNSGIAAAPNPINQSGFVDESLKLYGASTFNNEGKKLLSWNTRADGEGTKYNLSSDFTLSGEQYEKLDIIEGVPTLTLYAVWENNSGSGSGSGDNTDGDNDNSNTDTYLLAGILVVIIILIIVVAVVLRKKN